MVDELILNIERLLKEISEAAITLNLAWDYYYILNETIDRIVKEENSKKLKFSFEFPITEYLILKIGDYKSGLWYFDEYAAIPEDYRKINYNQKAMSRLFMLKEFITNLKKLTDTLDLKIKELADKRKDIAKILEDVKEILDPLVISSQLGQK